MASIKKVFQLLLNLFKRLFGVAWAHKILAFVIAGIVVGGWFFWGRKFFQKEEIQTVAVKRQDVAQTLEVSGEIDALEKVDLHFQALGKLAWIGVKEGDAVSQWQVIATQDARSVEKNMKKKLLAYMNERWDFDQSHDDYNTWGTPPVAKYGHLTVSEKRILEKAQFDLDTTVLDVEIQNLSLEISSLVTPISGIVTEIDTPVAGVNVITTDSIQVVNPDTLYFSAEIDEEDVAFIHEGQIATITLDAYGDDPIHTTITWIDFVASTSDAGGTVFIARLDLPEKNAIKYRLGMNGDVSIVVQEKQNALVVPFEALREENGVTYVNVLRGKTQENVTVETGIETDNVIEITGEIKEGDEIMLNSKENGKK